MIKACLPKDGLVDLAWKIYFAHFVCVKRFSCTYTKTRIRLFGSFKFLEFKGIFGSSGEGTLVTAHIEGEISCTNQTPQPVIISLFNSLKRLWWPLSLNPASGDTLTTPPLHSLIKRTKTDQFQNVVLKKWGGLFQPNQHSWNVGTIGNVITEKNLAASPWWKIHKPCELT